MARFETVVALRLPTETVKVLKAAARQDDRPLSSFLRRIIAREAEQVVDKRAMATRE